MDEKDLAGQDYVLWVSYPLKCISFHQESEFEELSFKSRPEMWDRVHELIAWGYAVQ